MVSGSCLNLQIKCKGKPTRARASWAWEDGAGGGGLLSMHTTAPQEAAAVATGTSTGCTDSLSTWPPAGSLGTDRCSLPRPQRSLRRTGGRKEVSRLDSCAGQERPRGDTKGALTEAEWLPELGVLAARGRGRWPRSVWPAGSGAQSGSRGPPSLPEQSEWLCLLPRAGAVPRTSFGPCNSQGEHVCPSWLPSFWGRN